MNRKFCLNVLGLPETATLEDIKKRFRELALTYHPDVNKEESAKVKFANYLKAYQYLLSEGDQLADMYEEFNYKNKKSNPYQGAGAYDDFQSRQSAREEMRMRAKEYAKAHQKEAEEIEERVFESLTKGWPWVVVRALAVLSCLFGLALLVDFWLPVKQNGDKVLTKVYYQYFQRNTVIYENESTVDVPEHVYLKVAKGDVFYSDYSGMLQEFRGFTVVKPSGKQFHFSAEFNLFKLYPFFPLLFLIPGILFYYKTNSVRFYMLYFITCVPFPGLLLHQTLREDKLTHFLTWIGF